MIYGGVQRMADKYAVSLLVDLCIPDRLYWNRYIELYDDPGLDVSGTFEGVTIKVRPARFADGRRLVVYLGGDLRPSQAGRAAYSWFETMLQRIRALLKAARDDGEPDLGLSKAEFRVL